MTFEAVVAGTTYNLNDGNPYRLAGVEMVGPSPVNRFGQRSPLQSGVTDLGFRLGPREIILNFNFWASADATLDTYRQSLHAIFKPTTSLPIQLRVTRDDGSIRTLNCFATDKTAVSFSTDDKASHLHRASVNLLAPAPAWKAAAATQETFTGTALVWWTANGVIGTANVMEHVEFPTQGQPWTYAGTITGEWTVAFRSGQETAGGSKAAFRVGTASDSTDAKVWWYNSAELAFTAYHSGVTTMPAGTLNYFAVKVNAFNVNTLYYGENNFWMADSGTDLDITGTARAWRAAPGSAAATRWSNEFPKAAVYNVALDPTQMTALNAAMEGTAIIGTVTTVNLGDFPAYPLITIQGPIINPILTNISTGKIINLYGITLGSGELYTIDLTTGDKTIFDANGVNQMGAMGTPSQLALWNLAPSPVVSGGTNSISVQGGSTSTSTQIMFIHTDEYWSL